MGLGGVLLPVAPTPLHPYPPSCLQVEVDGVLLPEAPAPPLPPPSCLQVEVDGVLLPEVHGVVARDKGNGGCYISCAPAFLPLVGKQVRTDQPGTN